MVLVEYAPSQKVPSSSKTNAKEGTIEDDKEYQAFVEQLLNPVPAEHSAPEADQGMKESPLLVELRTKIQEKRARAAKKEAKRLERERERQQRQRNKLVLKEREGKGGGRREGRDSKKSGSGVPAPLPKPGGKGQPKHGAVKLMQRPASATPAIPKPNDTKKSDTKKSDTKKSDTKKGDTKKGDKKKAKGKEGAKGGSQTYQNFLDLPDDMK